MGTQSHLQTIRLNELQTIGCQICPDVSERCCGAGENLAECLGVLQVPVEDDAGFIPLFWRLRPDSPGAVAFVATRRGESFLSHMVPSVTEAQKRNLLSDPIFQQEDLFAPATIGAASHAAKDVSLYKGAQSRPSMSSGTTQWRPSSSSLASRGRTQSSSAPATPQHSQASSSSKRFMPQKKSPDPPRGFFGVGVCPLFVAKDSYNHFSCVDCIVTAVTHWSNVSPQAAYLSSVRTFDFPFCHSSRPSPLPA